MQKIILNMENQIKRARLQSKYYTPTYRSSVGRNLPWLNLSGLWLERAGFGADQKVEIRIEDKQLTIKAV